MNQSYIDNKIIAQFGKKKGPFDYTKLISLLKGLNCSYANSNQYVCSVLIRAIVDVIPPLLGLSTFNEVANSYPWKPTYKKYMQSLLEFKNEGDDTLHNQISEDKDFLEIDKITVFRNRINVLLQECIKKGTDHELIKSKELRKSNISFVPKVNITLVEESKNDGWQNYSIGFYMGYSFKFILNVDNFNSNKLDYITPVLEARDSFGEPWKATYFIFETDKSEQNLAYEIAPGKEKKVTVVLSDQKFTHQSSGHRFKPKLDRDSFVLHVNTKSNKHFQFPIKASIV